MTWAFPRHRSAAPSILSVIANCQTRIIERKDRQHINDNEYSLTVQKVTDYPEKSISIEQSVIGLG